MVKINENNSDLINKGLPVLLAIITLLTSFIIASIITGTWLFKYIDFIDIYESLHIIQKIGLLSLVVVFGSMSIMWLYIEIYGAGLRSRLKSHGGILWFETEAERIKFEKLTTEEKSEILKKAGFEVIEINGVLQIRKKEEIY